MGINFIQEFPRSGNATDLTRININAYQMKQQNLNPRDPNYIQKGGMISSWSFIGFEDLQEAITHNWEPYDTMAGRANELLATAKSDVKQMQTTLEGVAKSGGSMNGALSNMTTEAARYKVDTPLVYTGSQRRQMTFTFTLQEYRNGTGKDVLEPIHEFRKLSCAGIEGQSIDKIDFPAIFQITSNPVGFVSIKDAALVDVQITWNSPYANGISKRAELTLTFLDLRPLYKSSWGDPKGNIITTDTE
jgi:hypothetical protein